MSFAPPVVPSFLRERKQWLVWKLVQDPSEPKPRKVPFYVSGSPRRGDQGTPEDLAALATYEDACTAVSAGRYTGLGFAVIAGSGVVALDFDHCVCDGQIMDTRIERLVSGTYAEVSPSGTGLRAFFTGTLQSRKDNAHKSRRVGGQGGAARLDGEFDIEVFGTNGFVTITGNHTAEVSLFGLEDTVLPVTDAVLQVYRSRFGDAFAAPVVVGDDGVADLFALSAPKLGWTIEQAREYLFACSASCSREEWLNALMALHHEFDGSDEALDLADEWSATGDSYAGRRDVEGRWRSFGRRAGGGITGRWLLAWRRDHLAQDSEKRMRDALQEMQGLVSETEDMLILQQQVIPRISTILLEFPVLELEAYAVVSAKAKKLGTPITKTEFKKLVKVERRTDAVDNSLPKLTEFGNTERMLRKYGENLMYVPDLEQWFVWTGFYWRKALGGRTEIAHFAKETIKDLPSEVDQHVGNQEEFYAFCAISQRAQMVNAMVALAESDHRVVVPSFELDKHSHYLGVKNGVVDLRTGQLMPPDRDLRITLVAGCDYNPSARAPLFERTIRDVFFDDNDMVDYVMRAFGYALTGNPKEDIMFVAFGNGANGKSTIFNVVREAFGDYARSADAASFVADSKGAGAGGPREDLVRLRGARFVYVNEPDEDGHLREGSVKSMTGGDTITARGIHAKSSVELKPTWTVFMPTNHKPIIRGTDNGIWRRMGMLPFERNFEKDAVLQKDGSRREKLRAELPGILALVVRSAMRYQAVGLEPPAKVKAARDEYRNQMDLLAEWIDECCDLAPGVSTKMADLWDSWSTFANRRGNLFYIKSATALGRRLDARFSSARDRSGARVRLGIGLKCRQEIF